MSFSYCQPGCRAGSIAHQQASPCGCGGHDLGNHPVVHYDGKHWRTECLVKNLEGKVARAGQALAQQQQVVRDLRAVVGCGRCDQCNKPIANGFVLRGRSVVCVHCHHDHGGG